MDTPIRGHTIINSGDAIFRLEIQCDEKAAPPSWIEFVWRYFVPFVREYFLYFTSFYHHIWIYNGSRELNRLFLEDSASDESDFEGFDDREIDVSIYGIALYTHTVHCTGYVDPWQGFSLSVQALAWRKTSKTLGVPDYNYLWVCYFNSDLVNYSYVPQESYNMTGRESLQSWQIRTCRRWSMNDGCHDGMFCLYFVFLSFDLWFIFILFLSFVIWFIFIFVPFLCSLYFYLCSFSK